jgi:hypothetical protein
MLSLVSSHWFVVELRGLLSSGRNICKTVWFPGNFRGINTPSLESWLYSMLFMEDYWLYAAMMGWRMMLCKVIS